MTIDEAKLRKMADEMLRQRCTSGDEHQYHIDQMKNFLKSDIVPDYADTGLLWSLSVFLLEVLLIWERVHDFQLGIESYQQKVNLTAPTMTFPVIEDHEIDGVITEPDYKNLNKNDIEDIYLLIMNDKKVNLTAPTMTFPGIKDHEMFFIIYEPVYGIIYKNNKKEKRVMRHLVIHKFCDATLNRVLEGSTWVSDDELGQLRNPAPQSPSLELEQAPLSPDYVPKPEYPEYLVPSDAEVPIEDQPLLADASPTALSLDYVADSNLKKDLEEDPANYPADGGDDDDESTRYDADDEDEEEASEEEEDDEEEEHLALADSFVLLTLFPQLKI
ncbi:hypothetical protein Tco_0039347 [Tanacetum coccineum]